MWDWLRSAFKKMVLRKDLYSFHPCWISIDTTFLEHIVQITSPPIRAADRYQERLACALVNARRDLERLCSHVPTPIQLATELWHKSPFLPLAFSNPESMVLAVSSEPIRIWYRKYPNLERVFTILSVTKELKLNYNMLERGGLVRQDVPQHLLVLSNLQFGQLVESKERLKQVVSDYAIEQLAYLVAQEIGALENKKIQLESQVNLQRARIRVQNHLNKGVIGEDQRNEKQIRLANLEATLAEVRDKLDPENRLALLESTLTNLEEQLRFSQKLLWVDPMGFVYPSFASDAKGICFAQIEILKGDDPICYTWLTVEIPRRVVQLDDPHVKKTCFFNTLP